MNYDDWAEYADGLRARPGAQDVGVMAWPTREEIKRSLERHVRQPRNTSANTWWLDELTDAILARFEPFRERYAFTAASPLIDKLERERDEARAALESAHGDIAYARDLLALALPLARAALDAMEPNQKSWSALAGIARIVNDMSDAQRARLRGA